MIDRCPICGKNRTMVGIAHLCIPLTRSKELDHPIVETNRTVSRVPRQPPLTTVEIKHRIAWSNPKTVDETPETTKVDQKMAVKRTKKAKIKPVKAKAKNKPTSAKVKTKRGRPFSDQKGKTLTATKPWEKDGISRASWYRRNPGKKS